MDEFYICNNGLYDLPEQMGSLLRNHILFSHLFVAAIGYYSAIAGFSAESLKSDRHFLIYCINGTGRAVVEGREYGLSPLLYLAIPAKSLFSLYSDKDDPWEVYIVQMDGQAAGVLSLELAHRMRQGRNYVNPGRKIADRFKELYLALRGLTGDADFIHLYTTLNRFLEPFLQVDKPLGKANMETDVVNQAVEFLKSSLSRNLSVADISAQTHLSVSKFSVLFKERTGYSPIEYFNLLKIQKACQLLSSTDLRINEVGREVGFNDAYYFSRLFRSVLNLSPKEYRRQQAQLV